MDLPDRWFVSKIVKCCHCIWSVQLEIKLCSKRKMLFVRSDRFLKIHYFSFMVLNVY